MTLTLAQEVWCLTVGGVVECDVEDIYYRIIHCTLEYDISNMYIFVRMF